MPEEWKCGLLIKLPKTWDEMECEHWRGVEQGSTTVHCKIMLNRMQKVIDSTC